MYISKSFFNIKVELFYSPYFYISLDSSSRIEQEAVSLCVRPLRNEGLRSRPVPGMLLLTFGCTWHLREWNFACVSARESQKREGRSRSRLFHESRKKFACENTLNLSLFLSLFFSFFSFFLVRDDAHICEEHVLYELNYELPARSMSEHMRGAATRGDPNQLDLFCVSALRIKIQLITTIKLIDPGYQAHVATLGTLRFVI